LLLSDRTQELLDLIDTEMSLLDSPQNNSPRDVIIDIPPPPPERLKPKNRLKDFSKPKIFGKKKVINLSSLEDAYTSSTNNSIQLVPKKKKRVTPTKVKDLRDPSETSVEQAWLDKCNESNV
jgi:hypothetical protein